MKRIIYTGLISVMVLIQGCALQQNVDHRVTGGLSRVGVISDESQFISAFPAYMGLDQVGIRYLDETSKGNVAVYIRRAEKAMQERADFEEARLNLSRALYLKPGDVVAERLIEQVVANPYEYAIAKNFLMGSASSHYAVKKQDTLKALSRKVYGRSDYYPFIMRINNMANISIHEGMSILLPPPVKAKRVIQKPKAIVKSVNKRVVKPTPVVESVVADAVQLDIAPEIEPELALEKVIEQEWLKPIDAPAVRPVEMMPVLTVETEETASPVNIEITEITPVVTKVTKVTKVADVKADTAATHILTSENKNREETKALLETPESDEQRSEELKVDTEASMASEAKDVALPVVALASVKEQKAMDLYHSGQKNRAYHLLGKLENRTASAEAAFLSLTDSLIAQPYAKGLQYYQEQKLDLAIAAFNQVLATDPAHGQAGIYRARCQKLLDKLSNIE